MGGRNKSDEGERDKRDRVETRSGSVSLTGEERNRIVFPIGGMAL